MKKPTPKDAINWLELCRRDAVIDALCEGVDTERLKHLGKGWVKLVLDAVEQAGYFGY